MTLTVPDVNLVLAWTWIILGTVLGLSLGSFFNREDFLDGYGSFKRRLYRLAHVAFFGLAILNLLFFLTARTLVPSGPWLAIAGWSFIVGALSMPTCCILVAHVPSLRNFFALPVTSVLLGSVLALRKVLLN